MDHFEELVEIVKIVIAILGGIVIAWYWNQRRHKLEQYRFLDDTYQKLLKLYSENPEFGDPEKTNNYSENWQGKEAWHYHYFAMTVHTVMESLYDIYSGNIPDTWIHIFQYHTRLHSAWLRNNPGANEEGYIKTVLANHRVKN